MSRLSESDRGILLSSMSDASCALTLGRSAAWVTRQRAAIAARPTNTNTEMPNPAGGPAPAPETPGERMEAAAETPASGVAAASHPMTETVQARAALASEPWRPDGASPAPRAAVKPRQARSPKPEARSPGVRPMTKPVKPEVVRYARWFLDARWRMATVANLFDVEPDDLAAAMAMSS